MKKIIIFVAIIFLAFIILVYAKNAIAKAILVKAVRQMTGLGVDVKYLNVGLQKTFIDVKGLNVFNPGGFNERLMADIPEAYVDFDLGAFLKGKAHLEMVRLNLREFIVIRNVAGKLNVNSIKGISKQGTEGREQRTEKRSTKPEIKIDVLELKIGRVLYKDYTQVPVALGEYTVYIDERYENITDVDKLVRLIVTRALINTAISKFGDLDFVKLKDDISSIFQRGKNIFEGAKDPEDVVGAIQNIGKQLENIFGGKESQ